MIGIRGPEPVGRPFVVPYDATWREGFAAMGHRLRQELSATALRIDHIGSTAVPGLDAKPIIDIQISVANLEPENPYVQSLARCGFQWRVDNPDRMKRYFREAPGHPRTHIHVRRHGSFSEQFALLFRDYLRLHPERCAAYGRLKHDLAPLLQTDREAYVAGKVPFTWETMRMADEWAKSCGWEPGPSDA